MLDIFDIFLVGGVFCGFITSILLFIQARRYQRHANRLLSLVIFPMAWYAFIYLLIKTGAISDVPSLFKAGSPLYYLIGPCSYLYVRSTIMDENRFRKWDWLHFLPAILHFIELLPFYFADAETKRQMIRGFAEKFNDSYQKGSGLIPAIWHFAFRPVHALIYLALQWVLLVRVLNEKNRYTLHKHVFKRLRTWLFSFTGLVTVIMLGLLVQVGFGIMLARSSVPVTAASWHMQILMTFAFFTMSAYLFFRPDILYGTLKMSTVIPAPVVSPGLPSGGPQSSPGLPEPLAAHVENDLHKKEDPARKETLLNEDSVKVYSTRIEAYLLWNQSFRKQGLTINQLSDELSMPVHHLSYVLNYHYKQRFNDFINQHRVDYVKELFKEEEWRKMKLETLATEAGFSSRSTFFVAFKKVTGLTPADYAKQAGSYV